MLVYGFRADNNKFQSVEKLAGRPVDKTCVEVAGLTTPLSTTAMTRKLAPISSVWHVKEADRRGAGDRHNLDA